MHFSIPEYVNTVLCKLNSSGFEAYLVGGCVRDLLLGQIPHDYDITTSADTGMIKKIFDKTVDTGIKHGTVTVISESFPVEVTTFRTDGKYLNHRKPESVLFVKDLNDDLLRRDFTVNALAYNEEKGIVDICGGISDLKNKILRTVGNPDLRFSEDALRILRLFRFSAQLNFSIEQNTFKSAVEKSFELENISRERIAGELHKLLLTDNPENIVPFLKSGCLKFLGIKDYTRKYDISALPKEINIRFFAFCENTYADAVLLCEELKMCNETKNYCKRITQCAGINENSDYDIKKALRTFGYKVVSDRILLDKKDDSALIRISENNEPYKISDLDINGNDLALLGLRGEEVGEALEKVLDAVIRGALKNTKEDILNFLK